MTDQLNKADRRRICLLSIGGVTYFLILLNDFRLLGRLPLAIAVAGTLLNAAILSCLIVYIRRACKRLGEQAENRIELAPEKPQGAAKRGQVRILWLAAGLYFVAMLTAGQFVGKAPYPVLLLGAIINIAVIVSFIVKLRNAYLHP